MRPVCGAFGHVCSGEGSSIAAVVCHRPETANEWRIKGYLYLSMSDVAILRPSGAGAGAGKHFKEARPISGGTWPALRSLQLFEKDK